MTQLITSRRILAFLLVALLQFAAIGLHAQAGSASLSGTIADSSGAAVPNAQVTITNTATGAKSAVQADSTGRYSVNSLPAGTYTVEAQAIGFTMNQKSGIVLAEGQSVQAGLTLTISTVVQEVTVNGGIDSVAVQSAPSGGFLEQRSAQSIISNNYIVNYISPTADYGQLVNVVPGAFTESADGPGNGQSKTYFRGFPDGDYDIDFDGIPFYDTNTPTHHSWSFFPVQWIGGVDFDRSPGSASTIGPTPFGGSIHYLSKPLTTERDFRVSASYGTWNSKLYDGSFNSGNFGLFGSPAKSNLFVDVNHYVSDGYQSFNFNMRTAGSLLYQYTFSPKTVLTGFSGVDHLNSNGPNISSTNCMLYGTSSAYTGCSNPDTASGLNPYTGAGIKFLLVNNADPTSWFAQKYNLYQVDTDFEYVGLKHDFGKGWYLDFKGYTLDYDNGELYSNAKPITEVSQAQALANPSLVPGTYVTGNKAYYDGVAIAPCNVAVLKSGVAALPCGIDKYNSYRKYGETALLSQTSHFGVFRAGMWYEWAHTNRHQYPSDPLNNWADQSLPKFNESFWTDSYQPFAEYEFHVTPRLNITAGGKLAYYTIDVLHHADDGSTVGPLTCGAISVTSVFVPCSATTTNTGSFTAWLPSLDFNYRLASNLSFYAQVSTGSVVPPSSVYDYTQTAASANAAVPQLTTPPQQQRSTTYQGGVVYKANRFTLDADAYHIKFQNTYSSTTDLNTADPDYGDSIYYLNPSSITRGVEFESTIILVPGLSVYLNGTAGNAYYTGSLNANTGLTAVSNPVYVRAPGGLWVQQTPTDTETQGLTYQKAGLNFGIFNMRVGEERLDNGAYHNQYVLPPFSTLGSNLNYTVRNHSIFDGTKIQLSGNNLLNAHNIQSDTFSNSANNTLTVPGACTTSTGASTACIDPFNTAGPTTVSGLDTPSIMAGRSFSVSVTFGFAPESGKKK